MSKCAARVCTIVFLIVLVMILIRFSPCSANTGEITDIDIAPQVDVSIVDIPVNDPKPPNDGPSIAIGDDNPNKPPPPEEPTEKGPEVTPLPKGGMSCATRKWYDEIYNGGIATETPVMDEAMETAMLYKQDYSFNPSKGFLSWEKFKNSMRRGGSGRGRGR